jgi:hypothetical protein
MNLGSWFWGFLIASCLFLFSIPPASAANRLVRNVTCGDINIDYSPIMLWPPNHKLQTITISATDTDKDADMLTVSNITSNQSETPGEGCGQPSGKQGPDFTGVGNASGGSESGGTVMTSVQLRAERCGKLGERVHNIEMMCSETSAAGAPAETSDTAVLTVIVPKYRGH